MIAFLALGVIAELTIFGGMLAALITAPDPFRLELFNIWVFAVLLALLNLRIIAVGIRVWRGGGFVRLDDEGVTNIKDGIGPIAWRDIRDASIRELSRVPRIGTRHCLFVDVADEKRGVRSIAIMGSPPHQLEELERTLAEIRARVRRKAS